MKINPVCDKLSRVKEICKTNIYTIIFITIFTLAGVAADSTEVFEDKSAAISFGFENDFNSLYIWRGLSYNEGFITHRYLWIVYNGFTFYTWSSLTLQDRNYNPKSNEVDFAIQYSKNIDSLISVSGDKPTNFGLAVGIEF